MVSLVSKLTYDAVEERKQMRKEKTLSKNSIQIETKQHKDSENIEKNIRTSHTSMRSDNLVSHVRVRADAVAREAKLRNLNSKKRKILFPQLMHFMDLHAHVWALVNKSMLRMVNYYLGMRVPYTHSGIQHTYHCGYFFANANALSENHKYI